MKCDNKAMRMMLSGSRWKRVPRRILGLKRNEVTGGWRKLQK
jgi:hypothetical protein